MIIIVFVLSLLAFTIVLVLGEGYLPSPAVGVLQAALTGCIAVFASLAVKQFDVRRRIKREVANFRSSMLRFLRWLENSAAHYEKRRAEVMEQMVLKGLLSSGVRPAEQARVFIEYAKSVEERWFSEVDDRWNMVLAEAGAKELARVDSALADEYEKARDGRDQVVQKAYNETLEKLEKTSAEMSDIFQSVVAERNIPLLQTRQSH